LETIVLCPVVTDRLEGVIAAFQDKEWELFVGSATSWWPQFFVSWALLFLPHRGWGSLNICSLSHDLIFSMANYFLFIWLVSWGFAQTWILCVVLYLSPKISHIKRLCGSSVSSQMWEKLKETNMGNRPSQKRF
jgi:hypothetical protein